MPRQAPSGDSRPGPRDISPGDALHTYQRALGLAPSQAGAEPLRGTADMHVGIAEVLLERDDLVAAGEHLDVSRRLGDHTGLPQNPYRWPVAMARLREAEGDLDDALALLDEAGRVYNGDYSPSVRPVPGEAGPAAAAARRSPTRRRHGRVSGTCPRTTSRPTCASSSTSRWRVLLARHRRDRDATSLDDALGLLDRLLGAAQEGGRGGTVVAA